MESLLTFLEWLEMKVCRVFLVVNSSEDRRQIALPRFPRVSNILPAPYVQQRNGVQIFLHCITKKARMFAVNVAHPTNIKRKPKYIGLRVWR